MKHINMNTNKVKIKYIKNINMKENEGKIEQSKGAKCRIEVLRWNFVKLHLNK